MCKGELILTEELILKIPRADILKFGRVKELNLNDVWVPLTKWKKSIPKYAKLEISTKCIKTWGKLKYKQYHRLVSEPGLIRSVWNYDFIPRRFRVKDCVLYFKIPNQKIGVWSITKNNKFHFIILPKYIRIDKKFCEGLGLLQGEMIRSMKGKSRHYISFTNSQSDLVNRALDTLLNFNITKNKISAQIILNTKEMTKSGIENMKLKSLDYWIKKSDFQRKQFVKILTDNRYRTNVHFGSLSIKYYDTFLRLIFQNIIEVIKKEIIPKNREFVKSFLSGLLAAEGSINLSPSNNSINFISVGVSNSKDRGYYVYLFKRIGIRTGGVIPQVSNEEAKERGWKKGTGGFFMIQGLKNYLRIYEYKLFTLSPKKLLYFLFGLSNHRGVRNFLDSVSSDLEKLKRERDYDFTTLLQKRNNLTNREIETLALIKSKIKSTDIAKQLKINKSSASRILNSICRKGFLEKIREQGKLFWSKK